MSTLPLQAQPFYLAGSGSIAGDASITLKTFKKIDGTLIAMADLGTIAYATIEPGNSDNEEQISFTGLTQNLSNETCTLTGVKSVSMESPYTATVGTQKTHAGSTTLVLSNTSGFYGSIYDYINNLSIAGSVPATETVQGIVYMPIIETTIGTTHSLTTVADEKVIVWAKGTIVIDPLSARTVSLKYDGTTKDTIASVGCGAGGDMTVPFSLQYTETPGAGTKNITVTTSGGTLARVVIIVMKIKGY